MYIAGPYRGKATHDAKGYFTIDANINRAREAAAILARYDIPFFCPHLNSAHFEVITPEVHSKYWLETDMVFVDLASALWLVEGWEDSRWTKTELKRAGKIEMPVFYPDDLKALIKFWRGVDSNVSKD